MFRPLISHYQAVKKLIGVIIYYNTSSIIRERYIRIVFNNSSKKYQKDIKIRKYYKNWYRERLFLISQKHKQINKVTFFRSCGMVLETAGFFAMPIYFIRLHVVRNQETARNLHTCCGEISNITKAHEINLLPLFVVSIHFDSDVAVPFTAPP